VKPGKAADLHQLSPFLDLKTVVESKRPGLIMDAIKELVKQTIMGVRNAMDDVKIP